MIREFIIPENQNIHINVPESYIGKMIEVIAFKVGEEQIDKSIASKISMSEMLKFYDKFNIDLSDYKFDRDEANER